MGRGNTENCAETWDAATQRTARQHGTRQHRELRGTMGRGNTENSAAEWDAAVRGIARKHGTRQHIERRDNPRKQGCAAALTGRGTIANNDVNEAARTKRPASRQFIKKYTFVTADTDVTVAAAS